MRRFLPFLIISLVALVTVGIATAIYRQKMAPAPVPPAAAPSATAGAAAAGAAAAAGTTASEATPPPGNLVEQREDETLHVRGPQSAPVTLEIYGDFQCPSCANTSAAIDELQKEYQGKVRVIFHEFPLAMHDHAVEAAMAAEAAGLQGHFWEMHDMLYKYQPIWSRASVASRFFSAYAESLGLDVAQFEHDAKSPEVRARVISDGDAGVARGVKNTPTIFINGQEARNAFSRENLKAAIEKALSAEKKGS